MVLVIKYSHIYKAQWPVDVTRFQVKSRNKSHRNGDSVGGGRIQHIEIFHMRSKILMKSHNKSHRETSRFSEKCSGKGNVGDKSRFARTKVGRICAFDAVSSTGNSLLIYVFIHLWSGVFVFVFHMVYCLSSGVFVFMFWHIIWCTVHHHICRAQWAMGHKGIVLCADADDGSMRFLYCFLHSPYHIICSITMRNRCNLTKTKCLWKFNGMNGTTGALLDMNVLNFIPYFILLFKSIAIKCL